MWSEKPDAPDTVTRGGVTLTHLPGTDRPRLLGKDGRVLFTGRAGSSCTSDCRLFATGRRVVLTYGEGDGGRLALVDPRRHTATWIAHPGSGQVSYAAAGGKLYVSGGTLADDGFGAVAFLLPELLSVVDVRTGQVTEVPAPYLPSVAALGAFRPTYLLDATGGRLVTVDERATGHAKATSVPDTVRVTGYASAGVDEPVALGGVPVSDWPAPCRLLSKMRTKSGDDGRPSAHDPIGIAGRPVRTTCHRYQTQLNVAWVAKTEQEAAQLFGSGRGRFGADQVRVLDDEARDLRMLRVGRVVVKLQTFTSDCGTGLGPCDDADTVAQAVVKGLHAQGF